MWEPFRLCCNEAKHWMSCFVCFLCYDDCCLKKTPHNTYFIGTRELTRILRITNHMHFSPSFPIHRLLKQPYGVLQLSLAVRRVVWNGVFFFTALRHPSILHTVMMNIP